MDHKDRGLTKVVVGFEAVCSPGVPFKGAKDAELRMWTTLGEERKGVWARKQ